MATNGNSKETKTLLAWLKDAYAMESAQIQTLDNHAKDAVSHPDLRSKLEQHAQATRRQAEALKGCIEQHGDSTSAIKNTMGTISGFLSGLSTGAAKDELVKNCLADYAAEHFEIACYKSLVAAAQACGDTQTAQVCEGILREEEEMADWLEQNISRVTQDHMSKQRVA